MLLLRSEAHVRERWACHRSLRAALDPRKAEAVFLSAPAEQRLEAWAWLEEEALAGRAWAQYSAGALLRQGIPGVTGSDNDSANAWIAAAASQGLPEAQYSLAAASLEAAREQQGGNDADGRFKDKLLLACSRNLHLAAPQGHTLAQYLLGMCYLRGEGVAKDPHTACQWLLEAAKM
eukprot:scaffold82147_cov42-Prasinocladus_malaysianus.AAC.2